MNNNIQGFSSLENASLRKCYQELYSAKRAGGTLRLFKVIEEIQLWYGRDCMMLLVMRMDSVIKEKRRLKLCHPLNTRLALYKHGKRHGRTILTAIHY